MELRSLKHCKGILGTTCKEILLWLPRMTDTTLGGQEGTTYSLASGDDWDRWESPSSQDGW